MALSDDLVGLTPEEQADAKPAGILEAFDTYQKGGGAEYAMQWTTDDGLSISILSLTSEDGLLCIEATANDGSVDLPVPDYAAGERFLFRNPPIRIWSRRPQSDGPDDPGETYEDIQESVHRFLTDAMRAYAANRGWSPVG